MACGEERTRLKRRSNKPKRDREAEMVQEMTHVTFTIEQMVERLQIDKRLYQQRLADAFKERREIERYLIACALEDAPVNFRGVECLASAAFDVLRAEVQQLSTLLRSTKEEIAKLMKKEAQ